MPLTRREFLRAAALCAAANAVPSRLSASQNWNRKQRPNVVLILADDLGYGDLGCYGQSKIRTPNIDRLASEGIRFTQAYAGSTVCAPSRCSLMTGMHNGHNRVRDNLPHGVFLQPDDVTVAEVLKQAGYRTGAILGKRQDGPAAGFGDDKRRRQDDWQPWREKGQVHA